MVLWRLIVDGNAVTLDEDMGNWPTDDVLYKGTVDGVRFTASYNTGGDYLQWVCQFKGGTLTGTFTADFSAFDAVEIVVWGPPGDETIVERSSHLLSRLTSRPSPLRAAVRRCPHQESQPACLS